MITSFSLPSPPPRQLLLNGCGRAPEAKLHLERRLARLAEQPLVEPATGSAQRLELVALCRCFALDTLCDGMGDYDGAAAWLNQQQQRRGTTVADPPSGASGAVVVGPLPLEQAQQLLLEVQERRKSRADQQAPGGGAPAAALPSGKQQRPPNPGARPSPSDFCTMTGGLSGEEEEGQAEGPLHSDATSSGEPSALKAPGTAAAAAIERRHALPPPPPASSARLVLSRWWIAACRKLRCLLLQCAARLNSIGGLEGATGSWPSTLYALASCALLFALVAEGRTLGAAAKLWWRQLRAALRSVMGELLAMGLSITPNPLTNGYTHRSSS